MRILILSPSYPFPPDNGEKKRIKAILEGLAAEHEVTFVAIDERYPSRNTHIANPWREITFKQRETKNSAGIKSLISDHFYRGVKFWNPEMESFIRKRLAEDEYDVIWINFLATSRYLDYWYNHPDRKHPLLILDQHNLDEVVWKRHQTNKNFLKRQFALTQYAKVLRLQKRWLPRFDLIFSVSTEDLNGTRKYVSEPATRLKVAPNGADLTVISKGKQIAIPKDSPVIVFGGSIDVTMNQDAVRWFLQEIFPIIENQIPGVQFWIVGRNPPPAIQRFAQQGRIYVTGTVKDITPYYQDADVFVIPSRMGGGTKLKTLEAMALGLPVVSTSIGVQGLDVISGKHLCIADDAREFANDVIRLLVDRNLASALGNEARKLIQEKYCWDTVLEKINKVMMDAFIDKQSANSERTRC